MVSFSELRAANWHEMTPARALLIPAVLTIAADGEISDAEIAHLNTLIAFNPTLSNLTEKAVDGLTNSIMDDVLIDGRALVISASAQALPPAMHETAFCFAVFAAMADGKLLEKEQDVLAEIAAAFGLSVKAVEHISHVVHVMGRAVGHDGN